MIFNKVKNENNAKVDCGIERVNKQTKKRNFREREKLRKFALLSHQYVHSCDIRKISSVMQLSVQEAQSRVQFRLAKKLPPECTSFSVDRFADRCDENIFIRDAKSNYNADVTDVLSHFTDNA